ncbi:transglycosylase domain-containing protein [Pimelobacter simplex]|uniref:transglycosylase domain-containing protein n=1 Tax=Nocardioides simplex TaxID=2045 RepID=UPI002150661D|nr:transglycosylase domain-containing protein [Pimelobacter simplex]UUW90962.1 penicillin-binding protein [Pimelobacter simplex]UUW94791.1 penicillin-binding protein [Pimelobacter simplex]
MVKGKRKSAGASGPSSRSAKGRKGRKDRAPRTWKQRLKRFTLWTLVTGLVLALLGVGAFVVAYKSIDIPRPNEEFLTQTTQVYYADGKSQLGQFAVQKRDSIGYDEMPQSVKDAVVASENQTFWTDNGLDPKGILRAAFSNAQGNSTQGASTITQQYVKILYLTQERTWKRKVKEAILSLKIKNQLSKKEILEGYLNTIYFGRGAYGVQAAAQAYFDRDAKDLNLRQSVVLAAVLNNPTLYDPANGENATARLAARFDRIVKNMAEMDTITAAESDKALAAGLPKFPKIRQTTQYGGQRGHVLTMVRKELLRLGLSEQEINGGGLQVTTTFTRKAMNAAAEGVAEQRPEGFGPKQLHVAVASVQPGTGAVRGIYAGQDYLQSQLNWAVAGGQAGSTFKPFALAAGLKAGFELKDTFDGNSPYYLPGGGRPFRNQGDTPYGRVNLIKATQDSINTAYIDLTLAIPDGPKKIIETANDMGIPPEKPAAKPYGFPTSSGGLRPDTGVSLGSQTVSPINMANGYATIANRGMAADPYIIEKVVDAKGVVRYDHKVTEHRALDEGISDDVGYALQQVVKAGSGRSTLGLGRPAGGKTGTATNGDGDVSSAWFVGYTPQLATAVMYVRGKGNEQLKGWLPSYFGGGYPAATWTAVMEKALEGEDVESLPPAAYVTGEAPSTGHAPAPPPPTKPTRKPKPDKPTKKPTDTPTTPTVPTTPPSSEPPTEVPTETPTDPTTNPGGILKPRPSTPAGNQRATRQGRRAGRRRRRTAAAG